MQVKLIGRTEEVIEDLGVFEVPLREVGLCGRLQLGTDLAVQGLSREDYNCLLDKGATHGLILVVKVFGLNLAEATDTVKCVALVPQQKVVVSGLCDVRPIWQGQIRQSHQEVGAKVVLLVQLQGRVHKLYLRAD